MQKKFMVRCDMEGVTGVVSYAQVEPGATEYPEAREAFMVEILALVEGLRQGGAGHVSIYDEHWFGRNLQVDRLPSGVISYLGKPPYRADWAGGLDETFSGLILHGLHSRAGTGALLHHTYEPDFAGIEINGLPVGEIGMEAAIAGDFGVPPVLVIADSAGCAEAGELFPGVRTVATKESFSADGALCHPLCDTAAAIRAASQSVAADLPPVAPFRFTAPIEVAMEFHDGPYLTALRERAADDMPAPNRLVFRNGKTVTELWAKYWALKLKCQEDLRRANQL